MKKVDVGCSARPSLFCGRQLYFFCNRVLPCRLVARRKYPQAVTFATARNDDEVEPAGDWAYFFSVHLPNFYWFASGRHYHVS